MTDITLEHYSAYESLKLRRHPNGVLELIMGSKDGKPGKLSTADDRMHRELADIWRDSDTDPDTRVVVIRGEGKGFSGGGDLDQVDELFVGRGDRGDPVEAPVDGVDPHVVASVDEHVLDLGVVDEALQRS